MNKEQIIIAAEKLPEYERKQIAAILILGMLNPMPRNEATLIAAQNSELNK